MNRRAPFVLAFVLSLCAIVLPPIFLSHPPAFAGSDELALKLAGGVLHNTPVAADTGIIAGGFATQVGYPVEVIRFTIGISSVSTRLKLSINDGNTTELSLLNSSTALATGELQAFFLQIADKDAQGDSLTYNLEFEDATTIDYLVMDRARLGSP